MESRIKLFTRSRDIVGRLPGWVGTMHSFVWLHILSPNDLDEITTASYLGSTGFETEEHNLGPLWEWETAAFAQSFSTGMRILVAGAGGGREMIALAKMGYSVVGFDPSLDLVTVCRNNLLKAKVSAEVYHIGPGEVLASTCPFDALVIGRGVYHHIPGSGRRVNFLRSCAEQLKDGSPVVLGDFLTRTKKRPSTAFAMSKKIEPGDSIGTSFFHYFTGEEIKSELGQAGFNLLEYRPTPFPGVANLAHALARSSHRPC